MTSSPHQVHILWGSVLDPETAPSTYEFATEAEVEAFWRGIGEADGYMEMEQVDGPDYEVDEDGDIQPVTAATPTPVAPNSRFVMWGEHPEEGTRASTYEFANSAEADAFIKGAEEMVGWFGYQEVPGPDYRMLASEGNAHLSDLGQLAAQALALTGCGAIEDFFMQPDGAYVQRSWSSGDEVIDFVPRADALMRQIYSIGLLDAGVDAKMLANMMTDYEDAPQEAVEWFGNKYDLTRNEEVGLKRPRM